MEIQELDMERQEARTARDFARADALRDRLQDAGVEVMDGQQPPWVWVPKLKDWA